MTNERESYLLKVINSLLNLIVVLMLLVVLLVGWLFFFAGKKDKVESVDPKELAERAIAENSPVAEKEKVNYWQAPIITSLEGNADKDLILYGKELITHTAKYFGPKGSVKAGLSNGMNCQNCHLDAGTKVFGNNYSAVASTYPKYRARSGAIENIYKRINDCFERSLNGQALDTTSKEMQAITAYIKWLGKDVPKGEKPIGSGFQEMAFLDRAADPIHGKELYAQKCVSCHKADGAGMINPDAAEYIYPPLWGANSYNDGAGLYRMSNFARYIKYNMPLGANFENAQLSDEEAWDIAAFVNSQSRPSKDISHDWPKAEEKPFDHPFGPYKDGFSEEQHKYGPFNPIKDKIKQLKKG